VPREVRNDRARPVSERWCPRLIRLLSARSESANRASSIALAAFLLAVGILMVRLGPAPMRAPWDVFTLLDGAWRIKNGQVPHVDYQNPIGPLTYLAIAFGMMIGKPSLCSVVYGNLLMLGILTPWAWMTCRNRLSSFNSLLFVIWVAFLIVAPRPLGYGVATTSYAMLYNRYGYAVLSILFVALFAKPGTVSGRASLMGGLSCGALVGLLLYCKITYFIAAVALGALRLVLVRDSRRLLLAAALGVTAVVATMEFVLHIPLLNYLRDVAFAGRAQSLGMRLSSLRASLGWNWLAISLTLTLLLASIPFRCRPTTGALHEVDDLWRVVLVTLFVGFFLTTGNAAEAKDVPFFFLSGLLVLESFFRWTRAAGGAECGSREAACLLAVVIVIPLFFGRIVLKDIASSAYSMVWNSTMRAAAEPSQRFESEALHDFVIPESSDWQTAYWRARDVPRRLNEGLALLRRHAPEGKRVFAMSLANPFSFALGLTPPKGVPLWWDVGFSFSPSVHANAEELFTDADLVIAPRFGSDDDGCCMATVVLMKALYGEYLAAHFRVEDRSQHWELLARRR
jgi:hypothetical protein